MYNLGVDMIFLFEDLGIKIMEVRKMYNIGTCKYCEEPKLRMINTSHGNFRVICLNCVRNWKVASTAAEAKANYEKGVRR